MSLWKSIGRIARAPFDWIKDAAGSVGSHAVAFAGSVGSTALPGPLALLSAYGSLRSAPENLAAVPSGASVMAALPWADAGGGEVSVDSIITDASNTVSGVLGGESGGGSFLDDVMRYLGQGAGVLSNVADVITRLDGSAVPEGMPELLTAQANLLAQQRALVQAAKPPWYEEFPWSGAAKVGLVVGGGVAVLMVLPALVRGGRD